MGKAQVTALKIQTLKKGWHDKDEILLHAAFQLLVDFIEKEQPEKIVDWNTNKRHRQAWREIKSLYRWWKETRPRRRTPLDDKKLRKPTLKFKKVPGSEFSQLLMSSLVSRHCSPLASLSPSCPRRRASSLLLPLPLDSRFRGNDETRPS